MPNGKHAAYEGAEPYFELVRGALGDLVDGEHFFDIVADDVVYEVRYDLGWPRVVRGRADLLDSQRGFTVHKSRANVRRPRIIIIHAMCAILLCSAIAAPVVS